MTAQLVRRTRLPAEPASPATARSVVNAAVTEAGLTDVLDEALLLTTELCTNGVVHAGTDLELEIVTTVDSITVTVVDFRADSRPRMRRRQDSLDTELAERGRGLLLVDKLAAAWGTLRVDGGKGVWFRLDLPASPIEVPSAEASGRP